VAGGWSLPPQSASVTATHRPRILRPRRRDRRPTVAGDAVTPPTHPAPGDHHRNPQASTDPAREQARTTSRRGSAVGRQHSPSLPAPSTTTGWAIFPCLSPGAREWSTRVALTLRMLGGRTCPRSPAPSWCGRHLGQGAPARRPRSRGPVIPYRLPAADDLPSSRLRRTRRAFSLLQRWLPGEPAPTPIRYAHDLTPGDPLTRPEPALPPEDGEVGAGLWLMLPPRGPPAHRPGSRAANGSPRRTGPWGPGTAALGPRVHRPWCGNASPLPPPRGVSGSLPDPRSDQRRAHRRPDVRDTAVAGRPPLYDQLVRLTPRRSSPSTGPSPGPPNLTARVALAAVEPSS